MKKIPPGSEASNVLVGEVEFLDHAIIAFVRLKEAVLLGDITEVGVVCSCVTAECCLNFDNEEGHM